MNSILKKFALLPAFLVPFNVSAANLAAKKTEGVAQREVAALVKSVKATKPLKQLADDAFVPSLNKANTEILKEIKQNTQTFLQREPEYRKLDLNVETTKLVAANANEAADAAKLESIKTDATTAQRKYLQDQLDTNPILNTAARYVQDGVNAVADHVGLKGYNLISPGFVNKFMSPENLAHNGQLIEKNRYQEQQIAEGLGDVIAATPAAFTGPIAPAVDAVLNPIINQTLTRQPHTAEAIVGDVIRGGIESAVPALLQGTSHGAGAAAVKTIHPLPPPPPC